MENLIDNRWHPLTEDPPKDAWLLVYYARDNGMREYEPMSESYYMLFRVSKHYGPQARWRVLALPPEEIAKHAEDATP